MKFEIIYFPICIAQITTGNGQADTEDIFDPLADIYEEFFDETSCFMSEKLYITGKMWSKFISKKS